MVADWLFVKWFLDSPSPPAPLPLQHYAVASDEVMEVKST